MARALSLAGVLLLTVWAYSTLATADFVYEDRDPLVAMAPTRFIDQRGPWSGWADEQRYFHPVPRMLSNVTMRIQGWTHAAARGFHLFNVGVHLVNGVLLFVVLAPMGSAVALTASMLFLLHPLNHEAVSYVSARPDLLYATCVLLLLLASERDGWMGVVVTTIVGGCAVLAKESAVVIVGLLPVWLLLRGRWSGRWLFPLGAWTLGGLTVIYRLVHVAAREGAAHPWGAISAYTSDAAYGALGYTAVQAAALWRLLALIVWPFGFSIDHDFDVMPMTVAAAALVVMLAMVSVAWQRRHQWPIFAFAIAWLAVSLSLRFVLPMPEYVHEQHLYVPLLGVWIALAVGGVRAVDAFFANGRTSWRWLLSYTAFGELHG